MSDHIDRAKGALARQIDSIAAGLWPSLSTEDRRDLARQSLGLKPCGEWPGAGIVYVVEKGRDYFVG